MKTNLKTACGNTASIALIYAVGCSSGMGKATDSGDAQHEPWRILGQHVVGYEHTAEQSVSDDDRHSLVSGNSDNIDDTRK